jgi:hypothetical protein
MLLAGAARGQELPDAPARKPLAKDTLAMFVVVGAEILADGVTTRVLYQRHYNENDPLAQPFVHAGVAGQIGASLLGAGATSGMWFALRRMHHNRAAQWFLRSVTSGEGCNVGRQLALVRTSRK